MATAVELKEGFGLTFLKPSTQDSNLRGCFWAEPPDDKFHEGNLPGLGNHTSPRFRGLECRAREVAIGI